jgi:mRNA interferase RelE/StbE
MFNIEWKENAIKELAKLEKNITTRIYKKVSSLKENFNSVDIKRLQNSNLFRLRIGDYRVLFEIKNNIILILKIGNRKSIYK